MLTESLLQPIKSVRFSNVQVEMYSIVHAAVYNAVQSEVDGHVHTVMTTHVQHRM